jgi:hypothetical protein
VDGADLGGGGGGCACCGFIGIELRALFIVRLCSLLNDAVTTARVTQRRVRRDGNSGW